MCPAVSLQAQGVHYSLYICQRIWRLHLGTWEIIAEISKVEKETLHAQGVQNVIRRMKEKGNLCTNYANNGRKATVPLGVLRLMDRLIEESQREITAAKLKLKITETFLDIEFSISTIKQIHRQLGWVPANAKYCQMIWDINKEKRITFVDNLQRKQIIQMSNFSNYILKDHAVPA